MSFFLDLLGAPPDRAFFAEQYRPLVATAFVATALAATAALAGPIEAIRIIGMTTLTGVSYATANDMIACRDCPEYFTIGHFDDGQNLENRPIRTLNPTLNALVWGPISSWHVSAIAGVLIAIAARLPILSATVSAASIAPFLAAIAVGTFARSHFLARMAERQMQQNVREGAGLRYNVREEYQVGWHTCNTRNSAGYTAVALGGLALTAGILAARVAMSIL